MSEDITSALLFARQPVLSATNQSFETTENPADIQQPPPHVVDHWFDYLGLSLDPTSSDNPPNTTGSPFQFPLFDGIINVSSFLCRMAFFGLVCALWGFLIGFH